MKKTYLLAAPFLMALSGCASYGYVGGGIPPGGYYSSYPSVEYQYRYSDYYGYGYPYYGTVFSLGMSYGYPLYRYYPPYRYSSDRYRPPHHSYRPSRPPGGSYYPNRPSRPPQQGSPSRPPSNIGNRPPRPTPNYGGQPSRPPQTSAPGRSAPGRVNRPTLER